jgi:hypothetical protein
MRRREAFVTGFRELIDSLQKQANASDGRAT